MIAAISAALAAMLKDESTFARAEALYSESFRAGQAFTVADGVYPRPDLVNYLMEPIYAVDGFDLCADIEPVILKAGLSHEDAEQLVDHLDFVELCNYKGEGEGFELTCRVSHLRVFLSKYDYLAA